MNRSLVVAALAAALAACAAKDVKPAGQADPPYVFPHAPHLENDVDCLLCHASIAKATALEARVRHVQLKMQDACKDCHDPADKNFKLPVVPARTREFNERFDHSAHLAKAGVTCKTCHLKLPDVGGATPPRMSMSTCTGCHKHQADFAQARCTPCHVDLKRYEKPVAAFMHQGDFLRIHGTLARPTAETCAQCHEQTFCLDCHSATTVATRQALIFPEQVDKEFIHRGDYLSRHMIDVQAEPASCRRCHGSHFCDGCHELNNVSGRSSSLSFRDPHPAGWANNIAGGDGFHGNQARKNIVVCAGCHDQGAADNLCVGCHMVGGKADNPANPNGPHPASFISKHRNDDRSKQAVCVACHHGQ
jgi:Cytochrome c7 and related cytochrome c